MTIVESTLSSKAFKRGLELDILADLAKAAAIVLVIYLVVRGVDLIMRGAWPLILEPTLQAGAFWAEVGLGVILPAILFAIKPLRNRPSTLFGGALLVIIFGVILNRLNVSWIGLLPYSGNIYFPSWMEIVVSITFVTVGIIAFGLAVRYLPVFPDEDKRGTHS
jgi:Ni/Fe-hydrogenase subunit HybB-like protein